MAENLTNADQELEERKFAPDELDMAILSYLQKDGRMPFTTIAKELDVAEATIRKRVNRLIEKDILRIVGIVNPESLGLNTTAIIGVQIEGNMLEDVVNALAALPEVRHIGICTGEYDAIVEIIVSNNNQLFDFLTHKLRKIPGVASTGTSLVLKVPKERYGWEIPNNSGKKGNNRNKKTDK